MINPSPKRIVAGLAVCQVLLLSNGVLMATVNALTGFALAPSRRMATFPIVTYVLGAAVSALPASFFMKRHGRRAGFMLGTAFGIVGGAVGALAVYRHSFAILLAGTFLTGIYNAFGQYYRFAAPRGAVDWKSGRSRSPSPAESRRLHRAVGRYKRDLRRSVIASRRARRVRAQCRSS